MSRAPTETSFREDHLIDLTPVERKWWKREANRAFETPAESMALSYANLSGCSTHVMGRRASSPALSYCTHEDMMPLCVEDLSLLVDCYKERL